MDENQHINKNNPMKRLLVPPEDSKGEPLKKKTSKGRKSFYNAISKLPGPPKFALSSSSSPGQRKYGYSRKRRSSFVSREQTTSFFSQRISIEDLQPNGYRSFYYPKDDLNPSSKKDIDELIITSVKELNITRHILVILPEMIQEILYFVRPLRANSLDIPSLYHDIVFICNIDPRTISDMQNTLKWLLLYPDIYFIIGDPSHPEVLLEKAGIEDASSCIMLSNNKTINEIDNHVMDRHMIYHFLTVEKFLPQYVQPQKYALSMRPRAIFEGNGSMDESELEDEIKENNNIVDKVKSLMHSKHLNFKSSKKKDNEDNLEIKNDDNKIENNDININNNINNDEIIDNNLLNGNYYIDDKLNNNNDEEKEIKVIKKKKKLPRGSNPYDEFKPIFCLIEFTSASTMKVINRSLEKKLGMNPKRKHISFHPSLLERALGSFHTPDDALQKQKSLVEVNFDLSDFRLLPLFAAGFGFSLDVFDSLLCQAYYTPQIIRFLELLLGLTGDLNDDISSRLISIPIPLYILEKNLDIQFRRVFLTLLNDYGIITIGIYRRDSFHFPYVYTAPYPDSLLNKTDNLYVICPVNPETGRLNIPNDI